MPKLTPRQQEEKSHQLALQERSNADGQRRFDKRNADDLGNVKEDVARGILKGGLTWQQSLDLPQRSFAGGSWNGVDPAYAARVQKRIQERRTRLQSGNLG